MQPDKQGFFKDTQQLAEEYIRERILLLKLEAAEKSAKFAGVAFAGVVIGACVTIILLLVSALACYLVQEATGSWLYGFGSVILFYVIAAVLLVVYRKSFFQKKIANFVIRLFFENNVNDNDEHKN